MITIVFKLKHLLTAGGCGSFFAISVESDKFKGMSRIKQHQLVNKILADEVKTWHGVQVSLSLSY
jgi:stress-induced morphogen